MTPHSPLRPGARLASRIVATQVAPPPGRVSGSTPRRTRWGRLPERWLLFGLFAMALGAVVYVARPILIPIAAAVFVSILFMPIARRLRRLGAPAPVAAGIVTIGVSILLTASVVSLGESLGDWIDHAPETIERLEKKLATIKEPVETIQAATANLEEITKVGESGWVQKVELRTPDATSAIMSQSMTVLGGLAICLALSFLLLCSGDQLVANTIRVASTFAQRRRALRAVRQLERDMSRFLALRTAVNALLGTAAYIVFAFVDLPNPLLWAVTMAILNYIPYIGATLVTVLVAIVSIVEFDDPVRAAIPPLSLVLLNVLEGFILTPLILGRCLRLHPVMIFLSTVFWGWMWGIAGALLAVPLLASVVIVFRHFPPLAPIARFLAGDRLERAPEPPAVVARPVPTPTVTPPPLPAAPA